MAFGEEGFLDHEERGSLVPFAAEQGAQANMPNAQQESVRQRGARYVDDVTDVTIDGDGATATVAVEGLFRLPVTPCGRLEM